MLRSIMDSLRDPRYRLLWLGGAAAVAVIVFILWRKSQSQSAQGSVIPGADISGLGLAPAGTDLSGGTGPAAGSTIVPSTVGAVTANPAAAVTVPAARVNPITYPTPAAYVPPTYTAPSYAAPAARAPSAVFAARQAANERSAGFQAPNETAVPPPNTVTIVHPSYTPSAPPPVAGPSALRPPLIERFAGKYNP